MSRIKKEPSKGKIIHIRLTDKSHTKLRILVAEQESTIQDLVSKLIESRLTKNK